jgi:hypothetical protein
MKLASPSLALFLSSFALLSLAGCAGSDNVSGTGTPSGSSSGGSSSSSGGASSSSGGSPAVDGLFQAPSGGATPDSLYGVWGGSLKDLSFTFDSRIKLSESSMTFATKCVRDDGTQSAVVGVTVAARVNDAEIAVLESKQDEKKTGDITCRANARPGTTKKCEKVDGFQKECFALDGTKLVIYGTTSFDKMDLTKISD